MLKEKSIIGEKIFEGEISVNMGGLVTLTFSDDVSINTGGKKLEELESYLFEL